MPDPQEIEKVVAEAKMLREQLRLLQVERSRLDEELKRLLEEDDRDEDDD